MSLEQYYTEEKIGERLVAMLPKLHPRSCLELGAGKGALLLSAIKKWPYLDIATCELDPNNYKKLVSSFPGHHYNVDVISPAFEDTIKHFHSSFDIAVSNPPFSWRKNGEYEKSVLQEFNLEFMKAWTRIRSEVIFILQNIRLIKDSGILAIILPELIIYSSSFTKFRAALLKVCSVCSLAEIKSGSFKGTEAKTYILILQKKTSKLPFMIKFSNGNELIFNQERFFNLSELEYKTDFSSIAESIFQIKRGRHSGKEVRMSKHPYYHTSGFSLVYENAAISTPVENFRLNGKIPVFTHPCDLLINRVGSRSIGKAAIAEKGNYLVSDCVFCISVPEFIDPQDVMSFWHKHSSNIIEQARGTCARYLTKQDVLSHLARYLELREFSDSSPYQIANM